MLPRGSTGGVRFQMINQKLQRKDSNKKTSSKPSKVMKTITLTTKTMSSSAMFSTKIKTKTLLLVAQ